MRGTYIFLAAFAAAAIIMCNHGSAFSVTIHSPLDGADYERQPFSLLWSADEGVDWAAYSINGKSNTSLVSWTVQENEDAYECVGTFSDACSNATDEDPDTYAKCQYPGSCEVNENFTIPESTKEANYTYKLYKIDGTYSYSVYYWNYTKRDWSVLVTTGVAQGFYQGKVAVPADGLNGSLLMISNPIVHNSLRGQRYYEGSVEWLGPNNVTFSAMRGVNELVLYANNSAGVLELDTVKFFFTPAEHTVHFTLNVTNTGPSENVYIPGKGIMSVSAISDAMSTNPPHWFISSFAGGVLRSLVFAGNSPGQLTYNGTPSYHTISLSQDLMNSKALLAFTGGNWEAIGRRMGAIEQGTFLMEPMPSFAGGMGLNYVIKMILEYTDIDFAGDLIFGRGEHTINFENAGLNGSNVVIQARSK